MMPTHVSPNDDTPAHAAEVDQIAARLDELLAVCREIQEGVLSGESLDAISNGLMDALLALEHRDLGNVASFALNLAAALQLHLERATQLPSRLELLEQGVSPELIAVLDAAGKVAPPKGAAQ